MLFDEVTFGIDRGQKMALVAKNGTGKTSLLRILAGLDLLNVMEKWFSERSYSRIS